MIARSSLALPQPGHPRILESVIGRMLELIVYSVEGIRDRVYRISVH